MGWDKITKQSNYENLVIFPAQVKNFHPFSCKKLAFLSFRGSESPERVKMSLIIVKFWQLMVRFRDLAENQKSANFNKPA